MEKVDVTIIGAGAIGLAIANELSQYYKNIILLEKNESFGKETSSRNSEVIHAGIYYLENSLKAKLCVEGKSMLYEFLDKHSIPFKKCGKYIVAVEKNEIKSLEALKEQAEKNDVCDLKFITRKKFQKSHSDVRSFQALFSPSTGIFDTHKFMQILENKCQENNVLINYNSEVTGIEETSTNYKITIKEINSSTFEFMSEIVINSTGLNCQKTAQMIGINDKQYQIYFAKGEYFSLPGKYKNLFSSLIYPVIHLNSKSLGIHTVLDLQGMLKLGPNIHYIDKLEYEVEKSHKKEFYNAVIRYIPSVLEEELFCDMSGIRPKLQGPDDSFRDFIIKEESEKGFPGFINLLGIESPGLTASLAIARYVKKLF